MAIDDLTPSSSRVHVRYLQATDRFADWRKIMNAYGVLIMFSLGMIVLPVGGFFLSKAILFEGTLAS